jgi:putative ABC transport system permease protein
MTATAVVDEAADAVAWSGDDNGGRQARRAVVRWAWRLFRREWRQQTLIVALLTTAIAAAIGSAAVAYNLAPVSGANEFGSANHYFVFNQPDPVTLPAKLDAGRAWFGEVDAIGHRLVPVPGLTTTIDYRVQDPDGPFGGPILDLRSGRYPADATEIAITDWVAQTFSIGIGSPFGLDGTDRTVVGIVENPSDLDEVFALLAPSLLVESDSVRMLVDASEERVNDFRPPGDRARITASRGDIPEGVLAALAIVVVSIAALFLVALVAAASFIVIAQRRLPQLGMLSAIGATEKHIRLTMIASGAVSGAVAGLLGAILGVGAWTVGAPRMETAVGFRIDAFNIPWWVVIAEILLAVLTATGAAWWPARTMARVPTVLALSGRPPRPNPVRRSAAVAGAITAAGVICLATAGDVADDVGVDWGNFALVSGGTLAIICGVLLAGPLAIRGLARGATRLPIAIRLALRDLSRYQARSGAALAAISLVIGIPIAIVAIAASAENGAAEGNLSPSQLIVRVVDVDGPFIPEAAALETSQAGVDRLVAILGDVTQVPLDVAVDPTAEPEPGIRGVPAIALAEAVDEGWRDVSLFYVASPPLLSLYGVDSSDIDPETGIAAVESGEMRLFGQRLSVGQDRSDLQLVTLTGGLTPTYTSIPGYLITAEAIRQRGWEIAPSGRWLIQSTEALTSQQLADARETAADSGFTIESRDNQGGLTTLRAATVAIGMLLALGVLAMTVGLIRSEAAGDVRTLTATGATSSTRRMLTAATAGGLATLGVVLGTTGAYVALASGHLRNLTPVPLADLAVICIGTPVAAAAAGWLLAGREPEAIGRRPIE